MNVELGWLFCGHYTAFFWKLGVEKIKEASKEQWENNHPEWGLTEKQKEEWQPIIDNDMIEFGLHIGQNNHYHTANGKIVTAEVLMIIIK